MTLCSLALVLALGISAASSLEVGAPEWRTWKLAHGKRYGSGGEDNFRLKIFIENQARIAKHNRLAAAGKRDYFLKMNHFGDLLHHEFVHKMNGYRYDLKLRQLGDAVNGTGSPGVTFITPANVAMPESFDWREKGAVTPVKDQGQCGSCWAFSSTGALEGQTFRATGKLISLSEQNLVDCSTAYGNNGCNGGLMDNAFQYIKDNGGIDTEVTYPYEAEDDKCRYNKKNKGASDKGFVDIPKGDEDKLAEAIASMGPVSVAIDASHESFQFYSHGVYSDPACDPANLDHGVLAVGYGVEADGTKYWLVKNSWSEKWGDKGYIKILRQGGNMCGVASAASYPLV